MLVRFDPKSYKNNNNMIMLKLDNLMKRTQAIYIIELLFQTTIMLSKNKANRN